MTGTMEPKTIPELFFNRVNQSSHATALLHKKNGRWNASTWKEVEQAVREVARGLTDWVQPKDIVCILSENRPEWWIADLATLSLAGVTAPIYPTNPPKDIAYILNDCGARFLFVSNSEQLEKIRQLRVEEKVPQLEKVIVFDEVAETEDWILTLSQLRQRNATTPDPIDQRMAGITEKDLATLIYTSGTTGEPKGVMLSHKNLVSNTLGAKKLVSYFDVEEKLMLSFLPLSHILERTAGYYVPIHYGFKVAFAESVLKLVDNMGEVRPTVLVSVPRIYEKLYARVMESAQSGLKKKLVFWALDVGKKHAKYRLARKAIPLTIDLQYALATKLVFSKLHERMGGRLKYAISGGAPLAPEIGEFLSAVGLSVCEGYGLSETSPVAAANLPDKMKVGTVGIPWPEVEIKIAPEPDRERDGEILLRGPNVMMGYYNKPEATAEALDSEGWFKTGDIGYIDSEGFLHITDRKKELIKTAGGKYVAPQPIENQLKVHSLIEQVVVIGDRRKYCVALIVPNFEGLKNLLGRPLPGDLSQLNNDPQVVSLIQAAVDEVNHELGSWEQLKRFTILPREMSQDTGELTPTMKIKRRVVDEMYKPQIDSMY